MEFMYNYKSDYYYCTIEVDNLSDIITYFVYNHILDNNDCWKMRVLIHGIKLYTIECESYFHGCELAKEHLQKFVNEISNKYL